MKLNYALISRSLIAFLFVVAGYQKLVQFAGISGFLGSLGFPMPAVVTAIVIFIEIVVAIAYAWGYRVCLTGGILIAFTALATILVHRDIAVGDNMVMALKNIAIIGGLLATIDACNCKRHKGN